ncbi:MAG: PBP1A family penicillin-binding protein [Myxococcota bacterium]
MSNRKTLSPKKPVGTVRSQRKRKPKGRLKKWLKRISIALLGLITLGFLSAAGVLWYYGRDLPTVDSLRDYQPPQTTRVLDRDGEVLGEIFTERRTVVPMDSVPRVLVLSVLAAEDADFFQHKGLDYPGIGRALGRDLIAGRPAQGASTITQQVVKLMLLSPERTISRKIRELILARRLEQELDKEEILHLYLNHINFGHGRYGVQEAAQFYFDKNVEDLTLAEASLIAGVPQAPARLSPRSHPEAAQRRQRYVLDQLLRKRERWPDLTEEEIDAARAAPMALAPRPTSSAVAPELIVHARKVLRELVSDEEFARGGYTIHTSIDSELQLAAREALQENLRSLDERHGYRGPLRARRRRPTTGAPRLRVGGTYDAIVEGAEDGMLLLDVGGSPAVAEIPERYNPEELGADEFAEEGARVRVSIARLADENEEGARADAQLELGPQGAVVVIEPRTREVVALVGGYDAIPGFNRATQAERQPGSSFKPIVYALGIQSRELTPASILLDAPAVYGDWRPSDFATHQYEGPVRLRHAVARSLNAPAHVVLERMTIERTISFARDLGVTTALEPNMSLAHGTSVVRPIELVNAIATFPAGGRWEPSTLITRIEGPDGDVRLPEGPAPRDVLTPAEAYVVTSVFTSVVQEGTARAARRLRRPAAGKTGTTDDAVDAWFVGFTPDLVAGVWVGFDDSRPLGRRESGSRAALPVWIDVMQAAVGDQPRVDFPVPSGVVTAEIDPESGLLAYEGMENAMEEVFLDGTVPTEVARDPNIDDSSSFLIDQLGGTGATEAGGSASNESAANEPDDPSDENGG